MSEPTLNLERNRHDMQAIDGTEESRRPDDRAAPDAARALPPARRPRITSLQQWLDLCA